MGDQSVAHHLPLLLRENIRYNSVATDEKVRESARKANALSFIEAQAELQEAEGTSPSGFD